MWCGGIFVTLKGKWDWEMHQLIYSLVPYHFSLGVLRGPKYSLMWFLPSLWATIVLIWMVSCHVLNCFWICWLGLFLDVTCVPYMFSISFLKFVYLTVREAGAGLFIIWKAETRHLPSVGSLSKWQQQTGQGQTEARSQELHPGFLHG